MLQVFWECIIAFRRLCIGARYLLTALLHLLFRFPPIFFLSTTPPKDMKQVSRPP